MTDVIRDYEEYRELRARFFASKGVQQYNAFLSNQLSYYTFESNYRELLRAVQNHFKLRLEGKLGDWNNKQPLNNYLTEITRLLHNFLASAKTLVDHTRCFVKDTYGEKSVPHCEYVAEIKRRFETSPINKFTLDLRTYMTHISMPFIASVMGGSKAVGRELFTLQLDIEKMGHAERWSSEAREYIRSCGDKVDLERYLLDYYQLIFEFYTWLGPKVEEWGRDEWSKTATLQEKLMQYENRAPSI